MGQLRGTTQLITAGNANLTTRSRGPRHQKRGEPTPSTILPPSIYAPTIIKISAHMREAVTPHPGVNVINDRLMYHQTPVSVWVDGRYLGSADAQTRIRKSGASLRTRKDEYHILNKHMALVVLLL